MEKISWPAWYYGPKGEAEVFVSEDDVPKGWKDDPGKFEHIAADEADPAKTITPPPIASQTGEQKPEDDVDLDADGWPWTEDLHAPTKSKTTAGLWRMKVGSKRPDPKPGYPKPALDL